MHECLTSAVLLHRLRLAQEKGAPWIEYIADSSWLFNLFYRLSAVRGSLYRVVCTPWMAILDYPY